jgi:hypothetical protein
MEPFVRLRTYSVLLALILYGGLAVAALAEEVPAPFTCTISPDGKSVRVAVSNPFDQATSCYVNCQFSTTEKGTSFQNSCGTEVPAGAKDVQLCVHEVGKGTLVKMTGGDGSCVKQLTEEERNEREKKSDADADNELKKAMKQGEDMLNRMKANKPVTEEKRKAQEKKSEEDAEDELKKAMKQSEDMLNRLKANEPD